MEEEPIVVYDLSRFKIVMMMMLKKLVFDFGMCGHGNLSLNLKGILHRVVGIVYYPRDNLEPLRILCSSTDNLRRIYAGMLRLTAKEDSEKAISPPTSFARPSDRIH
ncbi:hypothetical protein MKW92_022860 [Papaver armeniacum]|nr:hypothetical protein MKW92_022860 [Papaver armeniacum]